MKSKKPSKIVIKLFDDSKAKLARESLTAQLSVKKRLSGGSKNV